MNEEYGHYPKVINALKIEPLEALLNHEKLPYSGQPRHFLEHLREAVLAHPDFILLRNVKAKYNLYSGENLYAVGENEEPIVWVEFHEPDGNKSSFFFRVKLEGEKPKLASYKNMNSIWFTSKDPNHIANALHCSDNVVPS